MAKKPPREQTVYRDLACKLAPEDLDKKRDELAAAVLEEEKVRTEKSERLREYNERIKGLQGQAEELSEQIRAREEVRPVECRRVFDGESQRVALIRKDTDEVVDVRDMEPEEVELAQGEKAFAPDPETRSKILSFFREDKKSVTDEDTGEEAPADEPSAEKTSGSEDFQLTDLPGVGKVMAQRLADEGFGTLDALRGAIPEDLAGIEGMTVAKAEKVLLEVERRWPFDGDAADEPDQEVVRDLDEKGVLDDLL